MSSYEACEICATGVHVDVAFHVHGDCINALVAERDKYLAALEDIAEMSPDMAETQSVHTARRAFCKHEKIVEHRSGARDEKRGYYHCEYCLTPATEVHPTTKETDHRDDGGSKSSDG